MIVLSIDIDFFVSPTAGDEPHGSTRRLSEKDYTTAQNRSVSAFLRRCRLSSHQQVSGVFIRHHVQAFDVIKALTSNHAGVDELVHVDAHPDLGMGDSGYVYLLTNVAHRPRSTRSRPRRGASGLNAGNWVPFVVANGWVKRITFVPREFEWNALLPHYFRKPFPPRRTNLEVLKAHEVDLAELNDYHRDKSTLFEGRTIAGRAQFTVQSRRRFRMATPPDFLIVCQSPQFTPRSADEVIRTIRPMVKVSSLQRHLTAPVGFAVE